MPGSHKTGNLGIILIQASATRPPHSRIKPRVPVIRSAEGFPMVSRVLQNRPASCAGYCPRKAYIPLGPRKAVTSASTVNTVK